MLLYFFSPKPLRRDEAKRVELNEVLRKGTSKWQFRISSLRYASSYAVDT